MPTEHHSPVRRRAALAALPAPVAAALLPGCAMVEPQDAAYQARRAADRLFADLPPEARGGTFVVAAFVEAGSLGFTPEGRVMAAALGDRLVAAHGLRVVEPRIADALLLDARGGGESLLTRDARERARRDLRADHAVVGTVSREGPRVRVSVRAVRLSDGAIVAATGFAADA